MATVQLKTRVLPGGRIEVQSSKLTEGREVTLNIIVEDEGAREKKTFLENLGDYKGGELFKTAEEVDRYLKEERDSWGDWPPLHIAGLTQKSLNMSILEVMTRVLPGGGIKFEHPALPEGAEVMVTVKVVQVDKPRRKKKSFLENLRGYRGGESFKSIEEVDRYIKEERDSWGD